jgi:hypothetical protein
VPTGVSSTGGEREVPADEGCSDGKTSSRGITDPYPLYIEGMFCPRLCIFIQETNYYLYIPTLFYIPTHVVLSPIRPETCPYLTL